MSENFVHLSVRSDFSVPQKSDIGDFVGAARVKDYVQKASFQKSPAIAFTELGSMRGVYEQHKVCTKEGIKPIFGVEVYVTADHTKKAIPKDLEMEITKGVSLSDQRRVIDEYAEEHGYMQNSRELTTLTLWALDNEGLQNLFALTSTGWIDGFYYKPRVDAKLIEKHSAGVACGTGGPNSWVNRPFLAGKRRLSSHRAEVLHNIFGDRLYLEIRPHRLLNQSRVNNWALSLGASLNVPVLATQNAHYLNKGDLPYQQMLCAIGSGKGAEIESSGCQIDSYWLRTRDEMLEAFEDCGVDQKVAVAACNETIKLANKCVAEFNEDPFAMIIPDIDTGELSHIEYLRKLCEASPVWKKLESKGKDLAEYRERMEWELEQLNKEVAPGNPITFASYIIYCYEFMEMGRKLGAAFGPGRGSAAGVFVNWLIGITQVDPIEYGLLFSRFIAPNRIGPPDIDIDVDPSKRMELFEAARQRWGADCVAQISTFGKLKGKAVLNDVCRELKIPIPETREITKLIESKTDSDIRPFDSVHDAFYGTPDQIELHEKDPEHYPVPGLSVCREFDKKYPQVAPNAMKLEGKLRNLGVHAAGVVVSPKPLVNYIPLETRNDGEGRVVVTAFGMKGTEQTGLLKIDMLGLITVNTIDQAIKMINEYHGLSLTMEDIPLDDAETLATFTAGDFSGVFQYDSPSARKTCAGVPFPTFSVVADMTALNRPGPLDSGMANDYVERKLDPSLVKVDYCEKISEITKDTLGIMIYQEQIMRACAEVGLHENPDVMRKIIGKKLVDKIEAERDGFIEGASKSSPDMSTETANKLFDDIVTFGRYGFNKSHSVAYAMIGYICQYLKVHYPLEFFWALILTAKDEKRRHYAKDAFKRGIRLLPPNISKSGYQLAIDRDQNAIIGALTDIKGVGLKAATNIVEAQPFESFVDFIDRVNRRIVNSRVIKTLAQAGALDEYIPNVRAFLENADEIFHESGLKRFKGWEAVLAELAADENQWTDAERLLEQATVNPLALENPYTKLLNSLSVDIVDFGSGDFWDEMEGVGCWVSGTLTNPRVWQNTGFGDKPMTEAEMKHESFGKDYVSATLEADNGTEVRIKIDWNVYEHCEKATEEGTPILTYVVPDDKYQTLRAKLVLSLEDIRTGTADNVWTETVKGRHPITQIQLNAYDTKISQRDYKQMKNDLHAGKFEELPVFGLVTDIKTKIAGKKQEEMAWAGILSADGTYTVITIFSSDWLGGKSYSRTKHASRGRFRVGDTIMIAAESNEWRGAYSCQYKGGRLRVLVRQDK